MPYSKYTPKQKKLARVAPPRKKITAADLKKVRKNGKKEDCIATSTPNAGELLLDQAKRCVNRDLKALLQPQRSGRPLRLLEKNNGNITIRY